MIFKKGNNAVETPDIGMIDGVVWCREVSRYERLSVIHHKTWHEDCDPKATGSPVCLYHDSLSGKCYVWPTPDQDYEIRIRYYPRIKEE